MKNTIPFLFSLAKTNTVLARRLSGHGLAFSDFMILYYLNEEPNQKLRRIDLAEKLGLTASGVTRMLIPLEKLRIVSRDLNDDDARARYATLTEAGKTLLKDATSSLEMKLEDIIPDNHGKQVKILKDFLDKILDNILSSEYSREAENQ